MNDEISINWKGRQIDYNPSVFYIENMDDEYETLLESYYVCEADSSQSIISRIIDWCKRAINFIKKKILSIFKKDKKAKIDDKTKASIVEVNKASGSLLESIKSGNHDNQQIISSLEKKLSEINDSRMKYSSEELDQDYIKILESKMTEIENLLNDNSKNLSQDNIKALQQLLKSYTDLLSRIKSDQNNETMYMLKWIKEILVKNSQNGANTEVSAYPFVYSRTYANDYTPDGLLAPINDVNKKTMQRLCTATKVNDVKNGSGMIPRVTYSEGWYMIGYTFIPTDVDSNDSFPFKFTSSEETAKRLKEKGFADNQHNVIEFGTDMAGRKLNVFSGYIVNASRIKSEGIPMITRSMCFTNYIKAQKIHWYDKEDEDFTTASGLEKIKGVRIKKKDFA